MKRILFLLSILFLSAAVLTAQNRTIARGAVEGELYLTTEGYGVYNGWFYDTILYTLLHITEHGRNAEIVYGVNYLERDKMQPEVVLADATEGVVYIHDSYMKNGYEHTRLWLSWDYGKNWELRDEPDYIESGYVGTNMKGLIYRGGGGYFISTNYAQTFWEFPLPQGAMRELAIDSCEGYGFGIRDNIYQISHTIDCGQTLIRIPVDEEYVFGNISGRFPDVFRGGKAGEVYITSWFPDRSYKASFSADTGYHFRTVYHSAPNELENNLQFMSDRRAGDFYIVSNSGRIWDNSREFHIHICIEHYTDYGKTLVGRYCHDLTRDGVITTGIEATEKDDVVVVYPNPTNGKLEVRSEEFGVKKIEIFDVFGRKVLETNETSFDISHLPAGVYILRIETSKEIITKKVMKQ